ncbi:VOC family protein [Streptomyces canus]|uniref:VOC family protein n=1 Tax=Streptomyces canus TaxID=58343 RepID=UPI0036CD03A4
MLDGLVGHGLSPGRAGMVAREDVGGDREVHLATVRAPDGHSLFEPARYRSPAVTGTESRNRSHDILGTHRVMFTADDLDDFEDTVARLRPHGAELLGGIARFEDSYLLCYVRGPEGVIVGLAERLG